MRFCCSPVSFFSFSFFFFELELCASILFFQFDNKTQLCTEKHRLLPYYKPPWFIFRTFILMSMGGWVGGFLINQTRFV